MGVKFLGAAVIALLSTSPSFAQGWDPIGDITNPGRIIENVTRETERAIKDIPNVPRNVARETENAGREIDRMRLEANAQTGAPALQLWLEQSRNTARPGSSPIPPEIRAQLSGYVRADVLNEARYKVGDRGDLNLANLSIEYGDAAAVTLIDTIVFSDDAGVEDPQLWAHELKHVQQFRDWGTRDFAIRYLRSWDSVENDANNFENGYVDWADSGAAMDEPRNGPGVPAPQQWPGFQPQRMSNLCGTPYGSAYIQFGGPVGSPCWVATPAGPASGIFH